MICPLAIAHTDDENWVHHDARIAELEAEVERLRAVCDSQNRLIEMMGGVRESGDPRGPAMPESGTPAGAVANPTAHEGILETGGYCRTHDSLTCALGDKPATRPLRYALPNVNDGKEV